MSKKLCGVTTHLDDELHQALKNECFATGIDASTYIRLLLATHLTNKYQQAKNTADSLAMLENYENHKNAQLDLLNGSFL